jgi:hypothetical protein
VHAAAFAVSLYLPAGHVLPPEVAPWPQGEARYEPGDVTPHAPEQSAVEEPPVPKRPAGQDVHATAFAVLLYLPEGQGVLPLEVAPWPQGDARYEPGDAPHSPEQADVEEPPVPKRPAGQAVHAAAFGESL